MRRLHIRSNGSKEDSQAKVSMALALSDAGHEQLNDSTGFHYEIEAKDIDKIEGMVAGCNACYNANITANWYPDDDQLAAHGVSCMLDFPIPDDPGRFKSVGPMSYGVALDMAREYGADSAGNISLITILPATE